VTPVKPKPRSHTSAADTTQAVDEFMASLEHKAKDEIQAIRRAIVSSDARIAEGIKWNSPSFRTTEYFATVNLREKNGVGIILHLGAKVRDVAAGGIAIDDSQKLLKWLAPDRAMIVFKDMHDFTAKEEAFAAIIRSWVTFV